jgi:hypothetical protein
VIKLLNQFGRFLHLVHLFFFITIADFSGEQEKERLWPSLITTSGAFRSTIRGGRRRQQKKNKKEKKGRKET